MVAPALERALVRLVALDEVGLETRDERLDDGGLHLVAELAACVGRGADFVVPEDGAAALFHSLQGWVDSGEYRLARQPTSTAFDGLIRYASDPSLAGGWQRAHERDER